MESKREFEIGIEVTSSVIIVKKIEAHTHWEAIELLYVREGYHELQPDRSKYKKD
jgi:hypothetical protein